MTRLLQEPYVTVSRHTAPSPEVVLGLLMLDRIYKVNRIQRPRHAVSEVFFVCDGLCLGALVAVGPLVQASLTNTVNSLFDVFWCKTCLVIAVCWWCTIYDSHSPPRPDTRTGQAPSTKWWSRVGRPYGCLKQVAPKKVPNGRKHSPDLGVVSKTGARFLWCLYGVLGRICSRI